MSILVSSSVRVKYKCFTVNIQYAEERKIQVQNDLKQKEQD